MDKQNVQMRGFLIILFLIFNVLKVIGQPIKTTFLDYYWNDSKDRTSTYIKEIYKNDQGYKILIFTNPNCSLWGNNMKEQVFECHYKSLNPDIEDGYFKNKHFIGQYNNGDMTGIWYKIDDQEKIIDTLDYSFIIENQKYLNYKPTKINNQTIERNDLIQYNLANHIVYPPRSIIKNEQGKVIADVMTDSNGEIIQITIKQSVSKDLDKELIRVLIKYFPKIKDWKGSIPMKFMLQ